MLGKPGNRFDSAATTLALTAVAFTEPQRELETLKLLQETRYVHALDTSAVPVVEKLLCDLGLSAAADRLADGDAELLTVNACAHAEGARPDADLWRAGCADAARHG